jgi:hypothetical protein
MQRRTCLFVGLALLAGCSGTKASAKKARGQTGKRAKGPKGPKTMGNLLIEGYITDLEKGSIESRITAAKELAAMGSSAKAALPALKRLTKHADAAVTAAATKAIDAIAK